MAKYVTMRVYVSRIGDKAVLCTFHEGEPEEVDLWVPFKCLEDDNAIHDQDADGNADISVAKWLLKKNDVDYPGEDDVEDLCARFDGTDEGDQFSIY